jgi:isopenicillin N synthase-like dioxygenase
VFNAILDLFDDLAHLLAGIFQNFAEALFQVGREFVELAGRGHQGVAHLVDQFEADSADFFNLQNKEKSQTALKMTRIIETYAVQQALDLFDDVLLAVALFDNILQLASIAQNQSNLLGHL